MKSVLITNNHLVHYAGSELVTLDLARHFKSLGWETEVATLEIGEPISRHFSSEGIRVSNLLQSAPQTKRFDLIWAQHHPVITEYLDEENYSLCNLVINCLSPTEPLETPPLFVESASVILANSKETRDALVKCGLEEQAVMLFPNSLSDSWFSPQSVKSSNRKLRKIAVVSNHIPDEIGQLKENNCGLEVSFIGMSERYEILTPELVSTFDAVITIGRTVPQALAQMVPVFCYDKFGGPGWLIEDNFEEAEYFNFSGRCTTRKMESAEILNAIVVGFPEAARFSSQAQELCRMRYSLKRNVESVLDRASRTSPGSRLDKSRLHHIKRINRAYIDAYQKVSQLRGLVRARTADLANATQEIRQIDEKLRFAQDAATRTASEVGRLRVESEQAIDRIRERDDLIESLRCELDQQTAELTDRDKSIVQLNAELASTRNWEERVRGELRDTLEQQKVQLEALSGMVEILVDRGGSEIREQATELRHKLAYDRMLRRIREVVSATIPSGPNVLVISKGDERMLRLSNAEGRHFPQDANGAYAGYYPANSVAAIAHLEALRAKGADFLLIPKTAFWWLDQYPDFKQHLEHNGRLLVREDDACALYSLRERPRAKTIEFWDQLDELVTRFESIFGQRPTVLDCHTDLPLAERFPQHVVFEPPAADDTLPYLDKTVDLVAVTTGNEALLAEARRVANYAVIRFSSPSTGVGSEPSIEILDSASEVERTGCTSIIIPASDSPTLSEEWLLTLRDSLPPDFSGEVTLVHGSNEPAQLRRLSEGKDWLKVVALQGAATVELLNHAARTASGETLVFLNPGSLLFPGWLPAAFRTLRDWPEAGAIAAKVLFSDGRLKEAGRHVLADGSIIGIGEGAYDCDAPEFNFVSEVACCSSPALITRRKIFIETGGFDVEFPINHYAFADYCMKLSERKLSVYYQPRIKIVQVAAAELDTAHAETRSLFLERWGHRIQESCIPANWSPESGMLPVAIA